MAVSTFTLTFNSPGQQGDSVQIQDTNTPNILIEVRFESNSGAFSVPVTGNIDEDISNVTQLLLNAFNSSERYNIFPNPTLDIIKVDDAITGVSTFTEVLNNTSGRIGVTISNEPVNPPISIISTSVVQNASNPCGFFTATVETSEQADQLTSPFNQPITGNPFNIVDIPRDNLNLIDITVLKSSNSTTATKQLYVPNIVSEMFRIDILQSPQNNTVTVEWLGLRQPDFVLSYSLDNVLFSRNNSFSGLAQGNYTMYIKDDIGCSLSIPFEVTAFEPNVYTRPNLFEVSEQNQLITVDRDNNPRNPVNTLSYEEESPINYRNFTQLFEKTDGNNGVITEQYTSTYENMSIKLIDCQSNETVITPIQKTNNINLSDFRDVTIVTAVYQQVNYVGVQYITGNTYDSNLNVTGSYVLNGLTPEFMNVGDSINITGLGWRKVIDIIIVNNAQTLILNQLSNTSAITPGVYIAESRYNLLDYEVFEFSIDLSVLDGNYCISYEATDSEFGTKKKQTEYFNVSDSQKDTYLLQYYNSVPNETFYQTGINYYLRIPRERDMTYAPSDTQEVYQTDTNVVSIETTYRDTYTLETQPIPVNMVRKIGLAISNDRLFINGLSVLKNEENEAERFGDTNNYVMNIKLIRSDYAFISNASNGQINLPTGQPLGIDGLGNGLLFVN